MAAPSFDGRRVLALESRRAGEVGALIANLGGRPVVAPAMREAPLESHAEAIRFAAALVRGEFDIVIFLTGVGARALVRAVEPSVPLQTFVAALGAAKVVARGPKPLAALRELNVPVWAVTAEPSTWREIVALVDARAGAATLAGVRVAVQEYGVSNPDLLDALRARGAQVTAVPVYEWTLPDDRGPLEDAIRAICRGEIDVLLVTSGVQIAHLFQVARDMGQEDDVRRTLAASVVIASIGPMASEELARQGLAADLEPSHPKMGVLVREAAEQAPVLAARKRAPRA